MQRLVIGILAHVDAGKTTLSEALLYKCNSIRKLGRVDKKDAFLDNNAIERERGITVYSKQAVFSRGDVSFTLIDTPGHVDFSTEMERALSVLDIAVLVISGTDGIQAHTRTLWRLLKLYDIPTFIFINKMDREGCDRALLQKELEEQLSDACVPFCDPERDERIALCDEDVMENYLETGEIQTETIRELIGLRKLFPCYYGSALKLDGVDELLDGMADFAPGCDREEAFAARVYKIGRDTDGSRLTFMKITGGSLKNREILEYSALKDDTILLRPTGDEVAPSAEPIDYSEKVTQLRIYSGERFETTDCAEQGMVVAALGLTATYPGQVLGADEELPSANIVPVMTYKVVARDHSTLQRLLPKFRILEEEDPTLGVVWNDSLRELQIRIMGEIQLEIIKRQLLDRFGEDVDFDRGSVLYKETLTRPMLGVGHFEPLRHYAEAQLLIEPAERGSGINAESRVSTNELELNWQRLIMTHIFERTHRGVLTGAELTDVNIALVAGRAHLKHTEGGDFRQATYRAIRQGLMRARNEGACILLEPYYELTIELPRVNCGRAMTDIESRFGRITSQYETGNPDIVGLTAIAPVSTTQGYSKEVAAYTKGMGSVYCSYYGYLPCHDQDSVIASAGYVPEADLRNPTSSVFCAHGAGFVVEWNDVDSYKHLDWDPDTGRLISESDPEQMMPVNFVSHATDAPAIGTDEIDAIIAKTAHANKREKTYRNPFRKHRQKLSEGTKSTGTYGIGSVNTHGAALSGGDNGGKTGASADSSGLKKFMKPFDLREKYLLVDGYNIIFKWPELNELAKDNVDGARERLNDILCNYQAQKGCKLIVVYDAYRVKGHPTEFFRYHNIIVVYTKEAETADRFIERFAHENAKQTDISVATSDGLEQIIIRGAGCRLVTANDLLDDVKALGKSAGEIINRGNSNSIGTGLKDML